jgi:outer membrane lipoprotein-sorting protein
MRVRRIQPAIWALALMVGVQAARADEPKPPDVDVVLAKLDDLYRSKSSIARLQIIVVTPRSTRTMAVKAWTRGEDRALILVESPSRDAGTATLRVDENLWMYLPRVAKTMRIPPSMMLGSWMGTDFTNDDLVKESSYRKDFDARIGKRSSAPAGWWLTLTAKPGVVGRWAKVELLVSDDLLPIEERHYDRKQRLARTLTFDELKKLGGRLLPAHMVVTPADSTDKRTELRYDELALDVDVPDSTFSLSRLERTR